MRFITIIFVLISFFVSVVATTAQLYDAGQGKDKLKWEYLVPTNEAEKMLLINMDGVKYTVYNYTRKQSVMFSVEGPSSFRVWTSLDYTEEMSIQPEIYEVIIYLDGRSVGRYEHETKPDPKGYYMTVEGKTGTGLLPGELRMNEITIPAGRHTVEARLAGGTDFSAKGFFTFARHPKRERPPVIDRRPSSSETGAMRANFVKKLRFELGSSTYYDDNILRLDDSNLDHFSENKYPTHWNDLVSSNDVVTEPYVQIRLGDEASNKYSLRMKFAGRLYATNWSLNLFSLQTQFDWIIGDQSKLSLIECVELPHMNRNLLNQQDYEKAEIWTNDLLLSFRQQFFDKIFLTLNIGNFWLNYKEPFKDRSYPEYRFGTEVLSPPLWRNWSILTHAQYRLALSSPEDNATDLSYKGFDAGAGFRWISEKNRNRRFNFDYTFTNLDFSCDILRNEIPLDYLYCNRSDQKHQAKAEFTYPLTKHLEISMSYLFVDNSTDNVSYPDPHPGDITSYTQHNIGTRISYSFLNEPK